MKITLVTIGSRGDAENLRQAKRRDRLHDVGACALAVAATASIAVGTILNVGLEFLGRQTPKPPLPPGSLPAAVSLAASFTVLLAVTAWAGRRQTAIPPDVAAVMEV